MVKHSETWYRIAIWKTYRITWLFFHPPRRKQSTAKHSRRIYQLLHSEENDNQQLTDIFKFEFPIFDATLTVIFRLQQSHLSLFIYYLLVFVTVFIIIILTLLFERKTLFVLACTQSPIQQKHYTLLCHRVPVGPFSMTGWQEIRKKKCPAASRLRG